MGSFYGLPAILEPLVPRAPSDELKHALIFCTARELGGWPGRHAFVGKAHAPDHACQLEAEVYQWCCRQPGGGLGYCAVCGSPVFIPPETCLERVEDPDDEIDGGVHAASA